jgi:hypothetical protein
MIDRSIALVILLAAATIVCVLAYAPRCVKGEKTVHAGRIVYDCLPVAQRSHEERITLDLYKNF